VGDEKIIPRSTVKEVYASIEADLIYASENLAALPSQREEQQSACTFRKGVYQDNFQGGNYFRKCNQQGIIL
jgi:hypothetical protein